MVQYRDPEKQKKWYNNRYRKNRVKVLDYLGGCCSKCDISDYDVLQIDHVIPIKLPSSKRMPNIQMFFHILNDRLSKNDVQILCANCHMKKTVVELRRKYFDDYSEQSSQIP